MPRPHLPIVRILSVLALLLAPTIAQGEHALVVRGLPADAPLTVVAGHDGATLRIVADLKAGWHLYGRDVGGGQPVAVTVTGGAFVAAGALRTPMDDAGQITGKATLELPLRRTASGDGLTATMEFMVCDALQCLPPIELALATPLPVLLVAVDDGERTQRIAGFLRDRGCAPTVTTYATVTAAQCDAAAVVIADSPTFKQVRASKVRVADVPATDTPIVAVGLLGTQLLVANKVTMACGYI